jgi:hypothetical protein
MGTCSGRTAGAVGTVDYDGSGTVPLEALRKAHQLNEAVRRYRRVKLHPLGRAVDLRVVSKNEKRPIQAARKGA